MISSTWAVAHRCILALCLLCACVGVSQAAHLPMGPERDRQSDMAFPSVTGDFTSNVLTINGFNPNTQLDVGPGTAVDHTLFQSTLAVTGVGIDGSGNVSSGGEVKITLGSFAPTSTLNTTYGPLAVNDVLLLGTVEEVLLEGPLGNDNLEVAFKVTGGVLASEFTDGPSDISVLVINSSGLPSSWASDFSLAGTLNVIGPIPEPTSVGLALVGVAFAVSRRQRRRA